MSRKLGLLGLDILVPLMHLELMLLQTPKEMLLETQALPLLEMLMKRRTLLQMILQIMNKLKKMSLMTKKLVTLKKIMTSMWMFVRFVAANLCLALDLFCYIWGK